MLLLRTSVSAFLGVDNYDNFFDKNEKIAISKHFVSE